MLHGSHRCLGFFLMSVLWALPEAMGANDATHEASRPNIVVIMVDDMGYSDLGCYGGEIETPHLDRLAGNGLRFTQFCNYGRCCPTRAAIMTGLHPHQVGIGHMTEPPGKPLGFTGPYQGYLNQNCTTIAEVLRSAGYRTLMTGKWHLGSVRRDCWPLQRGFDRFYGCIAGGCNYFRPSGDRGITEGNTAVDVGEGFYTTDAFTEHACRFIEETGRNSKAPFFLYLAYNAPHWPLNAKWEDYLKYRGRYLDGWDSVMAQRFEKQQRLGLFDENVQPSSHVGPAWDSLTEEQQRDQDAVMAAYAGCIEAVDRNVGRLAAFLEETGEAENTILFFLSDNGACQEGGAIGVGNEEMIRNPPDGVKGVRQGMAWACASNTPFRKFKHFVHEGGAATPLIVHWPKGIAADRRGTFVRQFATVSDLLPTLAELGGGLYPSKYPGPVGRSMVALFGPVPDDIHSEPVYWEHEGNAAVRMGNWKLVREYQRPWELFDLAEDRTELNDLSAEQPERRQRMAAAWEQWAENTGVAFPQRFNMYEFLRKKKSDQIR